MSKELLGEEHHQWRKNSFKLAGLSLLVVLIYIAFVNVMTINSSYFRRLTIYFSFLLTCFSSTAQIANPCGVVAKIFPATADSVLPVGSLINLKSVSTNATSVEWLLDGFWSGVNTVNFQYGAQVGLLPISLVAHNGSCTDTTTVFYFSAGKPYDVDSSMFAYYGLSRLSSAPNCIDTTADGGFVVGGYSTLANDHSCGQQGLIVKLRDKGCVDWSRTFVEYRQQYFFHPGDATRTLLA